MLYVGKELPITRKSTKWYKSDFGINSKNSLTTEFGSYKKDLTTALIQQTVPEL